MDWGAKQQQILVFPISSFVWLVVCVCGPSSCNCPQTIKSVLFSQNSRNFLSQRQGQTRIKIPRIPSKLRIREIQLTPVLVLVFWAIHIQESWNTSSVWNTKVFWAILYKLVYVENPIPTLPSWRKEQLSPRLPWPSSICFLYRGTWINFWPRIWHNHALPVVEICETTEIYECCILAACCFVKF